MKHCSPEFIAQLQKLVGQEHVRTESATLQSGSRDCFHFSPVLVPQLESCQAEAIAYPESAEQLSALIALAVKARVPIIPRGGGTGNYGQGVPMQGGLMINTRRMKQIFSITPDSAHVAAGVNLWTIEKEAAAAGAELRMFPSTIRTSSAAGFITGGSGGIGSIRWGMLRDADNIRHARVVTAEEKPRTLDLDSAAELSDVLHNCGLTAFVSEVTFALAPKTRWHQYIYAFDQFEKALALAESLARDEALLKRLVTVFEWPVPGYFIPLVKRRACPEGKALMFLICDRNPEQLQKYLRAGGQDMAALECTYYQAPEADGSRGFQIYDFTWNHTTQWAMKADPKLTYLQEMFDAQTLVEQLRKRRARFGNQISAHIEFVRSTDDSIRAAGLSVLEFRSREQLWDIIAWSEANNIRIANPHTHYLDDDSRWYGDNFLAAKQRWDPHQLLNPGHLHALETETVAQDREP